MSLDSGSKLGPYEILEPIGKGGMGEVYRARDPRMGRDVAIKISAEAFSDRFSREVHAVAALSHPNVCTLHDVGPDYLVMEMVEGQTLADRIKEGAIPLDEALAIARQIAHALEAAHEKNIVHRDLKPANIKLKPDGTVKVLDFGLAMVNVTPSAVTANSPTFATYATQTGMIVGTAAYMAPEQARGKVVDKRADIWAFGVVLAEMVGGRAPFQGEDLTDMLASVVKTEPELDAVPRQLRRLIKKCLEKDPRKRLRDIGDVWELLNEEPQTLTAVPVRSRTSTLLPWAVTGILLLAMAALSLMHFREQPAEALALEFLLEPPSESRFTNIYAGYAPSPNGRYLIFTAQKEGAGVTTLWLRSMDSATVKQLPGTEDANAPMWSPDSKSIVFNAGGKLKRIELTGGAPLTLSEASMDNVTTVGTWNSDGKILFGSAAGLHEVSASGGDSTLLTKADIKAKETGHGFPQFLPDGKHFLFFKASPDPNVQGVYVSSLDNPQKRDLVLRTSAKAVYVPPRGTFPGYLLWTQEQTLLAQRFDPESLKREGDPIYVTDEIGFNPNLPMRAAFWVSDGGLLTYFARPERVKRPVLWMSAEGKELGVAAMPEMFQDIALSPDGTRLAIAKEDSGSGSANRDIWIKEVGRDVTTRVTFDAAFDGFPIWSPDGKWIAFSAERENGIRQVFRMEASGTGTAQQLTTGPTAKMLFDWSSDGKYLLYREDNPGTGRDLTAIPLDGERKPFAVVKTPFQESVGKISYDGRWIAYLANDSGRNEIYVQAFPGLKDAPIGRWQVTNGDAGDLEWNRNGKEIYYVSPTGKIMAVALQAGPEGVRSETPRVLFSSNIRTGTAHQFDVTGDAKKFLMIAEPPNTETTNRLTVISNWQATLGKRTAR